MAKFTILVKANGDTPMISISDGDINVNVYIPDGSGVTEESLFQFIQDFKKSLVTIYEHRIRHL